MAQMNIELSDLGITRKEKEESDDISWNREPDIMPELKVDCWCPAQFEDSHVAYTNRVCGDMINRRIRGINNDKDTNERLRRLDLRPTEDLDKLVEKITQRKVYTERKEVYNSYNSFITQKTSYTLFISALVLLIPGLLWWKISPSVWCGFNVEKTLNMAQQAQYGELEARQ
ncbi:pannexin 8 [Elysia marginata]|uniref:Pannexin 8 n=1 Tax=Elysia marginata TaxID=1093978 RepID=A0AAV4GEK6_9GAST|nr:pannexin 8 [Elysia marginata]